MLGRAYKIQFWYPLLIWYAILEPINCDLNFGPELLDFVFYRPDDLYSELRKNLEPKYPELDKLQKIKARVKQDFTQCVFITRGPRYLKTTSVSTFGENHFPNLIRIGRGMAKGDSMIFTLDAPPQVSRHELFDIDRQSIIVYDS